MAAGPLLCKEHRRAELEPHESCDRRHQRHPDWCREQDEQHIQYAFASIFSHSQPVTGVEDAPVRCSGLVRFSTAISDSAVNRALTETP